jgi:RimJ/RimL family protein N-acetyltransferase
MTARAPDGRPLIGEWIRLDIRASGDTEGLFEALDNERVWARGYAGGPSARPATPAALGVQLDAAAYDARGFPRAQYVVRGLSSGRILGTSTLGDVDLVNESGHIGWTAYTPSVWGTVVNPEAKLLLLGHAFDDCGLERVKLQTDANLNQHSQAAIRKLGARFEGILRHDTKRPDGTWRDTAVFSILRDEWPEVLIGLQARIRAISSARV